MFAIVQSALDFSASLAALVSLGKSCLHKKKANERHEISNTVVRRPCLRSLPGIGRADSGSRFGELRGPGRLGCDHCQLEQHWRKSGFFPNPPDLDSSEL